MRTAPRPAAAIVHMVMLVALARLPAQECIPCGDAAGPACESEPGWNMYWDEVCGNGAWPDPCRWWTDGANQGIAASPTWYASGEFVPLFRDAGQATSLQALGTTGNIVLRTTQLKPEFDSGARIVIGRSLGDFYRLEGAYLGSYTWTDEAAVRNSATNSQGGVGNLFSPFTNFGRPAAVGVDFNNFASTRFSSKFNSAEINVRRRWTLAPNRFARLEYSGLLGARYMNIDEEFNYLTQGTTPAPATNQVLIETDNQMIGPQIGALVQASFGPRMWVDAELKGAILNNNIDFASTYTPPNGPVAVNNRGIDRTAYLGDLNLQLNYQFAPSWTFRVGYNGLFMSGIAVASKNFESNLDILRSGPARIDHGSNQVLHGPTIGVVWTR